MNWLKTNLKALLTATLVVSLGAFLGGVFVVWILGQPLASYFNPITVIIWVVFYYFCFRDFRKQQ